MRRRSDPIVNAEPAPVPAEGEAPLAPATDTPPAADTTPADPDVEPGLDDDPTADPQATTPDADDDDEPQEKAPSKPDDDAPRQAPIMAPDRKRPGVLRSPAPKVPEPNRPSFDWTRSENGELVPNLRPGEEITDVFAVNGVEVLRTSCTRFIYLCTAAEYEASVDELIPRETFKACFPHAFE